MWPDWGVWNQISVAGAGRQGRVLLNIRTAVYGSAARILRTPFYLCEIQRLIVLVGFVSRRSQAPRVSALLAGSDSEICPVKILPSLGFGHSRIWRSIRSASE